MMLKSEIHYRKIYINRYKYVAIVPDSIKLVLITALENGQPTA